MTVLGLIVLIVLCCVIAFFAARLPAPWPMVAYAVIVVVCLLGVLSLFGFLGMPIGRYR